TQIDHGGRNGRTTDVKSVVSGRFVWFVCESRNVPTALDVLEELQAVKEPARTATRQLGTLLAKDLGTLLAKDLGTLLAKDLGTLLTEDLRTFLTKDLRTFLTKDL